MSMPSIIREKKPTWMATWREVSPSHRKARREAQNERRRAERALVMCACGEPRMRHQKACRDCYVPPPGPGIRKQPNLAKLRALGILEPKRCRCGLLLPCVHRGFEDIAGARQYRGIGWVL